MRPLQKGGGNGLRIQVVFKEHQVTLFIILAHHYPITLCFFTCSIYGKGIMTYRHYCMFIGIYNFLWHKLCKGDCFCQFSKEGCYILCSPVSPGKRDRRSTRYVPNYSGVHHG